MPFLDSGFLESDDRSRVEHIRQRYAPWFDFIDRLNRLALSILFAETPRLRAELYVATLHARAITLFQGAVLMAERGMATEARTLVRSCAETAIAIGCSRLDPTFFAQLDEDYEKHRIALANDLLQNLPADDPNITAEQRTGLRQLIADVSREYTSPHPRRINWAAAAVAANMIDLYMTVYRDTSGDAAHVSLKALERHVQTDEHDAIVGLRFHPEIEGLADTLSAAIASLLHATEAKLRGLSNAAAEDQLRALAREWNTLVETFSE
jgi:Family of unknown function (DUF5677)